MLRAELSCEPPVAGGLPSLRCPLPLRADVAVGVGPGLLAVCVGPTEGVGVGNWVGADVGVGVGVVGEGVRDGVGVGVGVAWQLQETLTEFADPINVIVSFVGQVMLDGRVMVTETCPLR